ncbi:hypothetical protein JCM3774_004050 [Rhodotorula dairenensis]
MQRYPPMTTRRPSHRRLLQSTPKTVLPRNIRVRFAAGFFLLGTLNNIIYVVILSAALDLVDQASTPKGIILLVNITPALLVKIGWPYFIHGAPRYGRRVAWCSILSFIGIIIVATSHSLLPRLCGIAIASFSSGLGEMTYLQKATLYGSLSLPGRGQEDYGGTAVGWFSSGTGAAGIGGAGLWWFVRGLGVKEGLLICSILPVCMAASYSLLLPRLSVFAAITQAFGADRAGSNVPYSALTATDEAEVTEPDHGGDVTSPLVGVDSTGSDAEELLETQIQATLPSLTTKEKIELAKPLFKRYMIPLFFVYLAEYTINSGVAPTLLYEVPTKQDAPVLALAIKNLRDYYPLWQLLYQTFVFVSRSSLSILHLPPLPLALLPLPTTLQVAILVVTTFESATSFLVAVFGEHGATWCTALLVCCEGLCGGAAYVNAFHRLATDSGEEEEEGDEDEALVEEEEFAGLRKSKARKDQEKEFQISSVGGFEGGAKSTGMPDSDPRFGDNDDTPYALVPVAGAPAAHAEMAESTRALVAPLAQSIVRSQISSAPTLLPAHLAQLVTALSLAARVSLRASALFIEAIVETLQRGTATGLGVTRRALIAAVGSARALHYVTQGLDWSGRGDDGKKIEDAFLQILDKYTNLGIYLIHHTFTLAELFAMSGFYLTLNTIQTGFHAAEESVRMFDSILGSNESSRALSSIITLVRTELTREDPRFGPTSLVAEQDRDTEEKQRKKGTVSNLTALTKALTAFACLQMATHRRTVRELKQRVVYDCTVVIDRQEHVRTVHPQEPEAPATPSTGAKPDATPSLRSPLVDPTPDFAGKYAGPQNPPRHRYSAALMPLSPLDAVSKDDLDVPRAYGPHHRSSSTTSAVSLAYSANLTGPSSPGVGLGDRIFEEHILTDVRGQVESRAASVRVRSRDSSVPSSPSRSRRTSVAFDLAGLGLTMTAERPPAGRPATLEGGRDAEAIFDQRPEGEITDELARLCGSPTRARSRAASVGGHASGEGVSAVHPARLEDGECMSCDEDSDPGGDFGEDLPPEVQAVLDELEAQYAAIDRSTDATASSSGTATRGADPIYSTGTHLIQTAGGDYSFEIEVEETVTTTTTTVRTIEQVGVGKVIRRETKPPRARNQHVLLLQLEADSSEGGEVRMDVDEADSDSEWIEIASRRSPRSHQREQEESSGNDAAQAGPTTLAVAAAATLGSTNGAENRRDIPKLQIVLASMTSKLSHRKRTVRRVASRAASSGMANTVEAAQAVPNPTLVAASGPWNLAHPIEAGDGASSGLVASAGPSRRSKAKSVLRSLRNSFKTDRVASSPSSGASTPKTPRSRSSILAPSLPDPASPPTGRTAVRKERILVQGEEQSSRRATTQTDESNVSAPPARLSPGQDVPPLLPEAEMPPTPLSSRPRHSNSMHTLRSTLTTTCREASLPTGVPEPKSGNFPHRHLVSNLQHFARYSSAAYGQSFLRIFGIAKHEFKFPHTEIHANNHAFAHHVGIHVEDILLSSFTDPGPTFATDKISQIVNYVAIDHSVKAVVLACRGSLGLADILTDLTCSYEAIPIPDGDPQGTYYVHSGMYCSSTTLQRGTVHDVIADALAKYPDYGLVLCGHSLGGGVASLLSILWSTPAVAFKQYVRTLGGGQAAFSEGSPISTPFVTSFASGLPPGRPISCYTYGVPCVASPDLVAYCRGLIISTVHNYDIVPTLSLGVLRDFKSMAMGFYAEQGVCEEIVGRVIGLYRDKPPAPSEPSAPSSTFPSSRADVHDFAAATEPADASRDVALSTDELLAGRGSNKALEPAYQDPNLLGSDLIASDVELSDWLWSLRTTIRASSDNEKLYPPGMVYVVENYGVFVAGEETASLRHPRREGRRVLLRAIDDVERRFSEPVFSRTMLSDHSPAAYEINCDLLAAAVM